MTTQSTFRLLPGYAHEWQNDINDWRESDTVIIAQDQCDRSEFLRTMMIDGSACAVFIDRHNPTDCRFLAQTCVMSRA